MCIRDSREALREIRMALLEADVNFKVVKDFVEDVRGRAVGREVLDSITPGQQIVKIVHDRLVELMGGEKAPSLKLAKQLPASLMLVGLQGCGKTTTAAKLGVKVRRATTPRSAWDKNSMSLTMPVRRWSSSRLEDKTSGRSKLAGRRSASSLLASSVASGVQSSWATSALNPSSWV